MCKGISSLWELKMAIETPVTIKSHDKELEFLAKSTIFISQQIRLPSGDIPV